MSTATPGTGIKYMLGIDVESTGQCMRTNFMPRFGAALVCIESGATLEKFSTFVLPPTREHVWEPRCLSEFWLTPSVRPRYDEILKALTTDAENTPTLEKAGENFVEWIQELCTRYGSDTMMIVSDTAGYDYAWLQTAMPAGTSLQYVFNNVYRPTMAVSNFYGGVARTTPETALFDLLGLCCRHLGIEKPVTPGGVVHDHSPQNDAETIAYEACAVFRALAQTTASATAAAAV